LNNPGHLGETARQLVKRGIMPTEDGWGDTNLLCARRLGRSRSGTRGTGLLKSDSPHGTWAISSRGMEHLRRTRNA
jgi:hypothetical protein